MKRTRYTEEQIVGILPEYAAGATVSELCRKHGMSEGTVYAWKGLCCTTGVRDSLFESSMVAGGHEQLVPYEVQDQELAFVQRANGAPLVRAQWRAR